MIARRPLFAVVFVFAPAVFAAELPKIKVERQPLAAQVRRVAEALALLGEALSDAERQALRAAAAEADEKKSVESIQEILDENPLIVGEIRVVNFIHKLPANVTSRGGTDSSPTAYDWRAFWTDSKVDFCTFWGFR